MPVNPALPSALSAIGVFFVVVSLIRFLLSREAATGERFFSSVTLLMAGMAAPLFFLVFAALFGSAHLLLAAALALGIVLCPFHPTCATSFLLALLMIRPWEYDAPGTTLAVLPKLLSVLSLLSWILYGIRTRTLRFFLSTPSMVLALYLVWVVIASVASGGGIEAVSTFVEQFYPIIFLWVLIVHTIAVEDEFRCFTRAIITATVTVIVCAFSWTVSTEGFASGTRLVGLGYWGNSNDLAALIVIALPLVLFHRRKIAFTDWLLVVFLLFALWWTQSRGAFLALGVMLGLWSTRFVTRPIHLIGPAVLGTGAVVIMFAVLNRDEGDLSLSQQSRWNFVIAGIRMVKAHPLFGVGMGNFPRNYAFYTPSFIEWGEMSAHSSWIVPLAETSLPGFCLFLAFIVLGFYASWCAKVRYPGVFLAFGGYLVVMSFLSHTYLLPPYLLVAIATAGFRVDRLEGDVRLNDGPSRIEGELIHDP